MRSPCIRFSDPGVPIRQPSQATGHKCRVAAGATVLLARRRDQGAARHRFPQSSGPGDASKEGEVVALDVRVR
eukprot:6202010-Pleurochrysis_carterae.AAC.3